MLPPVHHMVDSGKQGGQKQSATRQALPLVVARMAASVITVTIPLYLARKLSLEEYGTYKQAFLLCAPLMAVLPMGVVQSLYFFVPRAEKPRPVLLQTQGFNIVVGLLGFMILALAMPFAAAKFQNPALLDFRFEVAAYVLFFIASNALEPTLTTQGKTTASASVYVTSEIVKSVALLLPVILGYGLRGAIFGLGVFTCARFIATTTLIVRTQGPLPRLEDFRAQLAYALPFGAAMVLNVPQAVAHQYAVSLAVTPALFAAYAAGCFQVPLVDLLYQPTSEVLMVRVGELDKQGRQAQAAALFKEATWKLSLVFIPAAAFFFVTAPWIVRALFGDKFDAAVPVFRVSVLGIALASLPMDGLLRARGETRHLFLAYLGKAAVTVPVLWLLVPRFGLQGGIVGWLICEVFGKALLLLRLPRALAAGGPVPSLSEWLPVRELTRVVVATVTCAVVVLLLASRIDGVLHVTTERLGSIAHVVVAGTLFGGGLIALMQLLGLRPLSLVTSLRR